MNNYLFSIETDENNHIKFFDLYDKIEKIQYSSAFKIKDENFKTTRLFFIKNREQFSHTITPINKEKFDIFLESYYDDLIKMKLNQFLIKYGLEEHAI